MSTNDKPVWLAGVFCGNDPVPTIEAAKEWLAEAQRHSFHCPDGLEGVYIVEADDAPLGLYHVELTPELAEELESVGYLELGESRGFHVSIELAG